VQRERHTQWPTIPGSALKGILRDRCRESAKNDFEDDGADMAEGSRRSRRRKANEEHADLVAAFGPGKVEDGNSHAGALSLTDARILAFPVRSLRGVFAWVTCPPVLQRLGRDLALACLPPLPVGLPAPGKNDAACADKSPLLVDGNKLVLEEFEFMRKHDASAIASWVATRAVADKPTADRIVSHLAVLHDDDFTHFVRHATEIVARVGLDYERKTVKEGALFYQEFLPPETLFYSIVLASASRFERRPGSAEEMLDYLARHLPDNSVLQVGGDETTGKGLCLARLSDTRGS
jgi:CRISPR-associated protein Cmr4